MLHTAGLIRNKRLIKEDFCYDFSKCAGRSFGPLQRTCMGASLPEVSQLSVDATLIEEDILLGHHPTYVQFCATTCDLPPHNKEEARVQQRLLRMKIETFTLANAIRLPALDGAEPPAAETHGIRQRNRTAPVNLSAAQLKMGSPVVGSRPRGHASDTTKLTST
jgi:hypothetical protein